MITILLYYRIYGSNNSRFHITKNVDGCYCSYGVRFSWVVWKGIGKLYSAFTKNVIVSIFSTNLAELVLIKPVIKNTGIAKLPVRCWLCSYMYLVFFFKIILSPRQFSQVPRIELSKSYPIMYCIDLVFRTAFFW
jgi:hypothetical protein